MAKSREILLKLVRLAMGWEHDFTLPEKVNWPEVFEMAIEQGVSAIILDGYEVLAQKNPETTSELSLPENKELLLQAIGQVPMVEATYKQHVVALKELGVTLNNAGIPFLLMKGFACGQYYPNPKHRACGDIDIYPGDKYVECNEAIKESGANVDPYYYRHSASFVKGIMVENHKVLCDLRGPRKQTKALEAQLEEEGKKSICEGKGVVIEGIPIQGAKYPTANFNALFLPWHVSAHFMFERVTVRHLLDWALFLSNEGKDIDIEMFKEAKKKYTYGYSKFADILTALSMKYLNMPTNTIPLSIIQDAFNTDTQLMDKVICYMFEGHPKERDVNSWRERWNNVSRVWKERWKYRELYGMGVIKFLAYKGLGVVLKEGEHD